MPAQDPTSDTAPSRLEASRLRELRGALDGLARELGFAAIGVAGIDLSADEARLEGWLAAGLQAEA